MLQLIFGRKATKLPECAWTGIYVPYMQMSPKPTKMQIFPETFVVRWLSKDEETFSGFHALKDTLL